MRGCEPLPERTAVDRHGVGRRAGPFLPWASALSASRPRERRGRGGGPSGRRLDRGEMRWAAGTVAPGCRRAPTAPRPAEVVVECPSLWEASCRSPRGATCCPGSVGETETANIGGFGGRAVTVAAPGRPPRRVRPRRSWDHRWASLTSGAAVFRDRARPRATPWPRLKNTEQKESDAKRFFRVCEAQKPDEGHDAAWGCASRRRNRRAKPGLIDRSRPASGRG